MTSYEQPASTGYEPPSSGDSSMTDKAAEAAEQGKQAVGEVAHTAVDQAREVKDEAVKQARDLVGEAKGHLARQTSEQHRNLVDNLRSLGSELGTMADNGEGGTATHLVSRAHGHVNSAADWLDSREPGELLDEVKNFARQRPGVFLLGALVAGVAAGRLTRGAIAAHTDDEPSTNGSSTPTGDNWSDATTAETPVAPVSGFAPITGQTGYEQGYGQAGESTPGYSTGGGYAQPGQGTQQGNEFGYGSPSTYGNGGTAAYPTQPSGGPR